MSINTDFAVKISLLNPLAIIKIRHCYVNRGIYREKIQGECLLISSLSGKASRKLAESRGFIERFNVRSLAETVKRREPGILFISLPIGLLFNLTIMT